MKQRRAQWYVRLVLALAVGLILAIAARNNVFRGIGLSFFSWVERPATILGTEIDEGGDVFFSTRAELIDQVRDLEQRIEDIAIGASVFEDSSRQLEQTLALLEYKERSQLLGTVARVMVRVRFGSDTELVLDRGYLDGIEVLNPVIAGDGVLAGTIREAYGNSSFVQLITNENSAVGATLHDEDGTTGIVEGGYGSLVAFRFVPKGTEVEVNDLVVSSGIDPGIPRGLPIGLVNSIEEDQNAPFLTLFVEPIADLDHVRIVNVIHLDSEI